jgi:very-short-patch-repair endonuclease
MTSERSFEYYQREFKEKGRSPSDIAEEWQTYPNKIRRELRQCGFLTRSRSDAQKEALASGRRAHPTKGKPRSQAVRTRISETMSRRWEAVAPTERERRAELAKAQWEAMSDDEREVFQRKAGDAVRKASKEGSKLEKFLYDDLRSRGYEVDFHAMHLIPNTNLEADLYLPVERVVIEIDGPTHFFPIWGDESLKRHQNADKLKNDKLLEYGFIVIRVKHLTKCLTDKHKRHASSQIVDALMSIREKFPKEADRLIEVEVV